MQMHKIRALAAMSDYNRNVAAKYAGMNAKKYKHHDRRQIVIMLHRYVITIQNVYFASDF